MPEPPIRRVRFKRSAGLVEVLRLGDLRRRPLDHSLFRSQRRDFHLVQLVTAGSGRHFFEFGSVDLRRGDVLHVRPGQVDWFDEDSSHGALLLVFLPEALAAPGALPLRLANPFRPGSADFATLENLVRLIEQSQSDARLAAANRHLLRAFAAALDALHANSRASSTTPSKSGLCERFEALLLDYAHRHRDVGWYAEQLGVSSRTLARATAEVFEQTPKRHVDRHVALCAKRLLVHSDDSVECIAAALGFSEPTNFVKFFRRVEDTTPQRFRDGFRPGDPRG